MRLGAYPAVLKESSKLLSLYQETGRLAEDAPKVALYAREHGLHFEPSDKVVLERHRHRYEVNPTYVPVLEEKDWYFLVIINGLMVLD